jgi:hypothetical protein
MDNTQNLRKTKLFIRIIGTVFIVIGLVSLITNIVGWFVGNAIYISVAKPPLSILMLIGGGLLIAFRKGGLDIVFIVLRFYILFGSLAILGGLFTRQFNLVILGVGSLIPAIGPMIFLSRSDVESILDKKT